MRFKLDAVGKDHQTEDGEEMAIVVSFESENDNTAHAFAERIIQSMLQFETMDYELFREDWIEPVIPETATKMTPRADGFKNHYWKHIKKWDNGVASHYWNFNLLMLTDFKEG